MEYLTLRESNCKNCYKCLRHCPVKAIRFSGNQAYIQNDECILCGECVVVCPQDAKQVVSEIEAVRMLLNSGQKVVVSLAPSFIANFNGAGIGAMREALLQLGFCEAEETAIGATIVKNEYERLLREEAQDVIITSCCHSVNLLIQKYFPKEIPCLAKAYSPMLAHCRDIKTRMPGVKTVFIGPCIAKKDEAQNYGMVDAVLTFDELKQLFSEKGIVPQPESDRDEDSRARFFPTAGGILKSMDLSSTSYTCLSVDGVENCMNALRSIEEGNIHHCFIEMSACVGSCIGGPMVDKADRSPLRGFLAVSGYAGRKDFPVHQPSPSAITREFRPISLEMQLPTEEQIQEILHQMGKKKPEDELNCGTCGYNSCREKAIAVFQGKATITMCLPYMRDKNEDFADMVLRNIPNALIVVNRNYEVQQVNRAAMKMLNIHSESDVLGGPVDRIIDSADFKTVMEIKHNIRNKRVYLEDYGIYVEESIVYDLVLQLLFCILRDVTEEEKQRRQKEAIQKQSMEVADHVIERQMRIVQEISSLLGETAAESKIALGRLKDTISNG